MAFDYSSTAHPLSLPRSPSPEPFPTSPQEPWGRPTPENETNSNADLFGRTGLSGSRRLSTPYSRAAESAKQSQPLGRRISEASISAMNQLLRLVRSMTPLQQLLAAVAGLVALALAILFLVFSHRIFTALHPIAEGWRKLPGGWALLFLLSFVTAFPPMIGYSTTITLAGFVYGFPGGWPIVAGSTVVGSTVAFFASRTVISAYVQRLVGEDRRFVALGQVLRHDGLMVLVAIRLCPLPFSLSNGFLATIPNISPARFALATVLATPKLLVHVFIGDRLAQLAENGDMPLSTRVVNYVGIAFGVVVGITVGWVVYQRTMRRAKELALEEAAGTDGDGALLANESGYADVESGMLDPARRRSGEGDSAAIMDDDDISLWDTTEDQPDVYRDEEDSDHTKPNTAKGQRHGLDTPTVT